LSGQFRIETHQLKIIVLFLIASVFSSCVGQRSLYTNGASSLDCEVLAKKQQTQYRRALREGNANRRKKTTVTYQTPHQKESKKSKVFGNLSRVNSEPDHAEEVGIAEATSSMAVVVPDKTRRNAVDVQLKGNNFVSVENSSSNEIPGNLEFRAYRPNAAAWLGLAGSGVLAMCALGAFQNTAKRLSRWGKNNPLKARALIGAANLVVGSGCIVLGDHLYDLRIIVPEYVRLTSAGLFASAVIFYPNRYFDNGACRFSYLDRKFYDVGLFTVGAIMMMYAGNHYSIDIRPTYPAQTAAFSYVPLQNIASVSIAERQISLAKREFKQRLESNVENIKRDRSRSGKTVATILVILAFIALTFGVAALSCTIACAGSEPAAIAVFIAGSALIIAGLVNAIRAIHKSPKKAVITQEQPET
jgi:hypothetical protein